MVSLIVPRLTAPDNSSLQTSISTGLTSVPEAVALQYPTVDAIYQTLVQAAQASNTSLKQNDGSVLLDVTLQVRCDDGTLTTVAPENFPAEGVEVLLPYPQGTNRSCTFVITYMITSGERACQIEVLKGTRTKDGILVLFTSMSPRVHHLPSPYLYRHRPHRRGGRRGGRVLPQDSGQQPRGTVQRSLRVQRRPAPLHNGEKEEIRLIKNLPRPPVRGGFFCCLTATGSTAGRCRTTDPRWACPR